MTESNKSEGYKSEKHNDGEFNLYTEKIVLSPSVKYKGIYRFLKLVISAVLFGGIACFVFVAIYPCLNNYFGQATEKMEITIPKDDYPEGYLENDLKDTDNSSDIEKATIHSQENVGLENESSYNIIRQTMIETKKTIVMVRAQYNDTSDFLTQNETIFETSGLIFNETEDEYLIITSYKAVKEAKSIQVIFSDGSMVDSFLIKGDDFTDIAIIYIRTADLSTRIKSYIKIAELDNSYLVGQSDIVIAAGRLLENNFSINYGPAINVKTSESNIDSFYNIISTSIPVYPGDHAYIFNIHGKVIGIMKNETVDAQNKVIEAYGISDLKALIEKMSNRAGITYLGLTGENVTNNFAKMYSLPIGVYITQVVENSPAFLAGIQAGDVITSIGSENIFTLKSLSETLYKYNSGDTVSIIVKRLGKDEYKNIEFNVTLSEK